MSRPHRSLPLSGAHRLITPEEKEQVRRPAERHVVPAHNPSSTTARVPSLKARSRRSVSSSGPRASKASVARERTVCGSVHSGPTSAERRRVSPSTGHKRARHDEQRRSLPSSKRPRAASPLASRLSNVAPACEAKARVVQRPQDGHVKENEEPPRLWHAPRVRNHRHGRASPRRAPSRQCASPPPEPCLVRTRRKAPPVARAASPPTLVVHPQPQLLVAPASWGGDVLRWRAMVHAATNGRSPSPPADAPMELASPRDSPAQADEVVDTTMPDADACVVDDGPLVPPPAPRLRDMDIESFYSGPLFPADSPVPTRPPPPKEILQAPHPEPAGATLPQRLGRLDAAVQVVSARLHDPLCPPAAAAYAQRFVAWCEAQRAALVGPPHPAPTHNVAPIRNVPAPGLPTLASTPRAHREPVLVQPQPRHLNRLYLLSAREPLGAPWAHAVPRWWGAELERWRTR